MDDASVAAINAARLFQVKGEFERLGVECLSDFNLIQPRDLERMKMNVIHKRRFVAAFNGPAAVTPALQQIRILSAMTEPLANQCRTLLPAVNVIQSQHFQWTLLRRSSS
jgi:hypothetical protein